MGLVDFYDVRIIESQNTNIVLDTGEIEECSTKFSQGAAIRVLAGGSWGFTTTDDLSKINEALEEAKKIALHINKRKPREKISLAPAHKIGKISKIKIKKHPSSIPIEEKLSLLKEIERAASLNKIVSTIVAYSESISRVRYESSEGVEGEYELMRIGFSVTAVAREGGVMQLARRRKFGVCGYEIMEEDVIDIASDAANCARELLKAKTPKGGRFPVLLDQELAGVFIHEALGHAAEADAVLEGNSILMGKLGSKIASELITVYDDPTIDGFGHYPFDDEGIESKRTVIIENGILKSYLHSRETAAKLGGKPGNARAQGYAKPIVRMSNTLLEKGDYSFEELLEEMKNGIYLKGSRGGQVDPGVGIFQFNAERGYTIEKGELKTPLRDVSLSASTLEILENVVAVGRDLKLNAARCSKGGQTVPVGDGSPHILISNALVGGSA
ncbi:MAG: TldD/PmbA family protein [Methanocellales archaeon]